jgi:radical SAM protein with 4Fe4S-binding SPASM domain
VGVSLKGSITTNGLLLNPEIMDWLDAHRFGMLLSLDGPPWIHDQTRGGWDKIGPAALLRWRPELEVVWTITASTPVTARDLDWLLAAGFRRVNFNVDHECVWPAESLLWLGEFFQAVGRRIISGELLTNWSRRLDAMLEARPRQAEACGTGRYMLALSPEGWLYPSQEMVYAAALPGRREDALDFYRVGDVFSTPVLDPEAQRRVADTRTSRMRPQSGHSCEDCCAISWCLGGCHCSRIGSGNSPEDRYLVGPGTCRSNVAVSRGLLGAAAIHGYRRAQFSQGTRSPGPAGETRRIPIAAPGRAVAAVPDDHPDIQP